MNEADGEAPDRRTCIRCLLKELADKDQQKLEKYLKVIRPEDRASEETVEKRLAVCMDCERLVDATCTACGCYVEFRASMRDGHCPKKKW